MPTKNTSICGYCNQPHPASGTCACPEQQRAHQARRREIDARYAAQRQGVAVQDPNKRPPRS